MTHTPSLNTPAGAHVHVCPCAQSLPLGGSLVTLTEFCRTLTGKHLSGMELRKSLKSLWMMVSLTEKPLMTFSIRNIHEAAK